MPGFLDFKPPRDPFQMKRLRREARWDGISSEYQRALAQTLARSMPDFYIVFHFNGPVKESWALNRIKLAWAMFERRHLGRDLHLRLDRCTGPIILENLDSNEHANILVKMAPDMANMTDIEIQEELFPIWKKLVRKGDVYVDRVRHEPGQRPWESRLSEYVVKQVRPNESVERLFWLEDFWPSNRSHGAVLRR